VVLTFLSFYEQGIRTHVYTVHILPDQKKAKESQNTLDEQEKGILKSTPSEAERRTEVIPNYSCEVCSKAFPNSDALFQHQMAKHQSISSVSRPSNRQNNDNSLDISEEEISSSSALLFQCSVCLMKFPSPEDLNNHMEFTFQPKNCNYQFVCEVCEKYFHEERALLQHKNFCQSKRSSLEHPAAEK
jgi:hypothetical protein